MCEYPFDDPKLETHKYTILKHFPFHVPIWNVPSVDLYESGTKQ